MAGTVILVLLMAAIVIVILWGIITIWSSNRENHP